MGANPFTSGQPTVIDLLDDWTVHFAFQSIKPEVERAYAASFDAASVVTANAEGTVELARRFGRDDVILLPNGVDPQRFDTHSQAAGPTTIGYVGKIGKRLDLDLILKVAAAFPGMQFIFAGPILDAEYRKPLESMPNVELLGDVHYEDVPSLLTRFDIGWVPHNVGVGEVGGDVIKTYEYRAAGLPVLTTPIEGANSRGLTSVAVIDRDHQVDWIHALDRQGERVARAPGDVPADATWQVKSRLILQKLGLIVK
ncbi:glycosyltransferase [Herbiconiux flava]|uniref:Glycosyltransferase involved in cell wall biosynthesis n=1 Tax=Herbiconiux flava TaxID=881268 RepID=A0A852S6H0_9MICO|nr:glycosyltransferase [Herbiconiux flava]NYD68878.1 glycosyltransferase involved in cell wall biosynthesis [Herbiconiux flava]